MTSKQKCAQIAFAEINATGKRIAGQKKCKPWTPSPWCVAGIAVNSKHTVAGWLPADMKISAPTENERKYKHENYT